MHAMAHLSILGLDGLRGMKQHTAPQGLQHHLWGRLQKPNHTSYNMLSHKTLRTRLVDEAAASAQERGRTVLSCRWSTHVLMPPILVPQKTF
jgi:hypothetical protein